MLSFRPDQTRPNDEDDQDVQDDQDYQDDQDNQDDQDDHLFGRSVGCLQRWL